MKQPETIDTETAKDEIYHIVECPWNINDSLLMTSERRLENEPLEIYIKRMIEEKNVVILKNMKCHGKISWEVINEM